jgi:hypothetical protein
VANADECRLCIGRIAYLTTQASTLDLHSLLLGPPGQDTFGGPI